MRPIQFLFTLVVLSACKNNGASSAAMEKPKAEKPMIKEIIVDAGRKTNTELDFSVLGWNAKGEILEVVVRYSGGCEERDFNAYFSGSWLKSMPPKAIVELEHLNPKNDACRSLVKDTLRFNMKVLAYPGANQVHVKWSGDPLLQTTYELGK